MEQAAAGRFQRDRLIFAVFLAASLHLAVILGVGFQGLSVDPPDFNQLSVTLALHSEQQPEDAEHVAERSQQAGAAEQADFDKLTQVEPATPPAPDMVAEQVVPDETRQSGSPNPQLVTSNAPGTERVPLPTTEDPENRRERPELQRLSRQLDNLQAELDAQNQAYARRPRVKRLTSVSAREAIDAGYLHQWRTRVEAVGNRYYPEASVRRQIYGSLRLLVVVRADGSLEKVEVLASSGHDLLDRAAQKIVHLAAPFDPFPPALKATTDKLEIIRTWQFQENRLSSR